MESFARVRALTGFVEGVRAFGGDPDSILRLAGIDPEQLGDPLAWVPFRAVLRAIQLASHTLGARNFWVYVALHRDFAYMGPLTLAARYSPNLETALEAISRYIAIQNTGYRLTMSVAGKVAIRAYHMSPELRPGANQWIEGSLMSSKLMMEQLLGHEVKLLRVLVRHKPLRPKSAYLSEFGAPVLFGQEIDAIEVDRNLLRRSLPTRDDMIEAFITSYLEEHVQTFDGDIVMAAGTLLETFIPMSQGRLEVVAEHLKLHPRTLQRRLKERGYSFSALLEEKRRAMADRMLREGNVSLATVANFLGYSEQSAFNHAFERWHGKSPLTWLRKRR